MRLPSELPLAVFLVGIVVSIGLAATVIPNERSYWAADFTFVPDAVEINGSEAHLPLQLTGEVGHNPRLTLGFAPHVLPFMSSQMKSVAQAYLSVQGQAPNGSSGSIISDWEGNSSGVNNYPTPFGWNAGDGTGNLAMVNRTVTITPSQPANFLTVYNFQNRTFSSNVSDVIMVSVEQVENVEWYLNVLINDSWVGLKDIQGIRTRSEAGTFLYQLDPNLNYGNPSFTARLLTPGVFGFLEMSQIMFGHIEGGGSASLTVNGILVGSRNLAPTSVIPSYTTRDVEIVFSFSFSILQRGRTIAVIVLDGRGSWAISAVKLHIFVDVANEFPQAWSQIPFSLVIYGGSTVFLTAVTGRVFRAFLLWLKKN